jgi:hypothetical protein
VTELVGTAPQKLVWITIKNKKKTMKTKDLIKLLQEADPNGEFEVCIENADIESYDILHNGSESPLISFAVGGMKATQHKDSIFF